MKELLTEQIERAEKNYKMSEEKYKLKPIRRIILIGYADKPLSKEDKKVQEVMEVVLVWGEIFSNDRNLENSIRS
jgi:hypothetical protein